MYTLYDMTSRSIIDKSKDEIEIIKTIATHINLYSNIYFLIKYHDYDLNMDDIYKVIKSKNDFIEYYEEYEQKEINKRKERKL